MATVIEGGDFKTKASIPNLYKVISQTIIKNYYASKNEIKLDKYLKDAIRNLKKINLIEARSQIELERYRSTQYPGFLWQEKINYKLHFFASTIGFIDGFIDNCTKEIEFYSSFNNKENEINEYKNNQTKLLEIRNNILTNFTKRNTISDPTILISTLETIPAHKSFSELYNDAIKNKNQLNLQQELISAYNIGYTSVGHYNLDIILNLYKKLNEELQKYEDLNKNALKKEKDKILYKSMSQENT